MSLESLYFKKDFYYNAQLVEKFIMIIQTSTNEKRVRAFKSLVFKMMKDIVKKNMANYLNLLRNSGVQDLPNRDDLLTDCFIIFDKCVERYLVGRGYNFYFYFNKSLSRNFYRDYQKEIKRNNSDKEITDVMTIVNSSFHITEIHESEIFIMSHLGFTDTEMMICKSKISGQKTSEFLRGHPDITSVQYSRALRNIKDKLLKAKENNDI